MALLRGFPFHGVCCFTWSTPARGLYAHVRIITQRIEGLKIRLYVCVCVYIIMFGGLFRSQRGSIPKEDKTASVRVKPLPGAKVAPIKRVRVQVRIPDYQAQAMQHQCDKWGVSMSEATALLYSWVLNKKISIEVIKRVKEHGEL